ncbi:CAP domain-containing protein [Paracoccus xiamenensis]|uniref:CAP domain-containing protein n=1 Tax=Paracoccus xiamenensis TaxID=2714901 RepID=UPI0014099137|nr:CAP domain-containing protein [Paracoccus xiamenensis]NHF71819.1 CAP domain-containing protein [Paracoccus xiamenensis]
MFRTAYAAPFLTVTAAALALGACSPDNLASAGDSSQAVGIVPIANQSLPDPIEQELAPICSAPNAALIEQVQQQLNTEREARGRKPLKFKENLTFAAQSQACDMATMGRLSVVGSNGSSVVHRVRAVEYGACSSAQLIGRAGDGFAQVAAWMAHDPDEEIIVHNKFDDAGVGVVQMGGSYWWSVVMADSCG